MRLLATALSCVVLALTAISLAQASSKRIMLHKQQARYYHADGYIKAIGKSARRTIYNPNPHIRTSWQHALHWLMTVRVEARREIQRLTQPAQLPHLRGWLCIHSREGAWNDATGNGYYGGLQAHYNWYGVARMDLLTPQQQIQHADWVARQHGYSYSFMRGQWPNTYPPCAGYFNGN